MRNDVYRVSGRAVGPGRDTTQTVVVLARDAAGAMRAALEHVCGSVDPALCWWEAGTLVTNTSADLRARSRDPLQPVDVVTITIDLAGCPPDNLAWSLAASIEYADERAAALTARALRNIGKALAEIAESRRVPFPTLAEIEETNERTHDQ